MDDAEIDHTPHPSHRSDAAIEGISDKNPRPSIDGIGSNLNTAIVMFEFV
jgi:hypothetical protein